MEVGVSPLLSTEKLKGKPVADETAEWIVNPLQFAFTCWQPFIPTRNSLSLQSASSEKWK
jgi:hypothetical protein